MQLAAHRRALIHATPLRGRVGQPLQVRRRLPQDAEHDGSQRDDGQPLNHDDDGPADPGPRSNSRPAGGAMAIAAAQAARTELAPAATGQIDANGGGKAQQKGGQDGCEYHGKQTEHEAQADHDFNHRNGDRRHRDQAGGQDLIVRDREPELLGVGKFY
jgi:hypothetical protein